MTDNTIEKICSSRHCDMKAGATYETAICKLWIGVEYYPRKNQ